MVKCDNTTDETERFKSVEILAKQMFDKLPDLRDEPLVGGSFAGPRTGAAPDKSPARQDDTQGGAWQALTDKVLSGRLTAGPDGPPPIHQDVSYRTAYRRARLPEGVEPLRTRGVPGSDADAVASIRHLLDEEDRVQRETRIAERRLFNQTALPPLEPQQTFDTESAGQGHPPRIDSVADRVRHWLTRTCRNYYVAAFGLSAWSMLATMVFIDRSLATALFLTSLAMLLAAGLMLSGSRRSGRSPRALRAQNT